MPHPLPRIDPEFKALIPPLREDEYRQLEQNILVYKGCRDAIVVWGSTIVDGHNRFRICAEHGVPFEIKEMEFESRDEAKLWIGVKNETAESPLPDWVCGQKEGGLSKVSKPGENPINVHKVVANKAGVSDGTVHMYMQILKHGSQQLIEAVKTGRLKIGTAHRLLDSETIKQLKHADKLYRVIESSKEA